MEIGAIINILRTLPEPAALNPGDLLKVNVLEVFDAQRALVDLGRFRAMATITFPAAAGDELWVRVVETQDRLRLQLVPTPRDPAPPVGRAGGPVQAASAESLQQTRVWLDRLAGAGPALSDVQRLPREAQQILDALRTYLDPFQLGSSTDAVARKLREFCEGSGLFLELRLADALKRSSGGPGPAPQAVSPDLPGRILVADLKARLMLLREFFESSAGRQLAADRPEAAGLVRAAAEMLADIRAGQEQLARTAAAAEPSPMIHFALPLPAGRHPVRLKIAHPRRRSAKAGRGHHAAILLELDRMGAVRADLVMQDRSLNVSIRVSAPDLRDLITGHAAEIREALSGFFDSVAVHVSVSAKKIARFATEDWPSPGEPQVDVRI